MKILKKQSIRCLLWIGWIVLAGTSLFGCSIFSGKQVKSQVVQPTGTSTSMPPVSPSFTNWRTSTPEEQGMDSTELVKMLTTIRTNHMNIHSILVIRNGFIISETYLPPFQADLPQDLASCGKSFASALAGIAIDKGYLKSADQKMVDLFKDRAIANNDADKQSITLKDMLTMSAGLDWDEWRPADAGSSAFQMQHSQDAVQFVLDQKMTSKPGERWNYSEGLFNLVSLVVSQSSKMSVPVFAQKFLFDPIDVRNVNWGANPGGGYAIALTPRDAAKFGLLFLNNGSWNGNQVISSAWVKVSTADHIKTGIDESGYGYFWWRPPFGGFAATGDGGQRIHVLPDKNLIVVITAGLTYPDMGTIPNMLMNTYILPAIKSTIALPENPAGVAEMNAAIQTLAKPEIKQIPPFPAVAGQILGKNYVMKPNSIGLEKVGFNFIDQNGEVEMTFGGRSQKMAIGLDNTYRINQIETMGPLFGWIGLRGVWMNDNTFIMDILRDGLTRQMVFTFNGDTLKMWLKGSRGENEEMLGSLSAGNP